MKTDITGIITGLLTLLSGVVSAFLIPYLKTKLDREKYERLVTFASAAVDAAEQIYGAGRGEEKFAYASALLERKGYFADEDEIRNVIEACVRRSVRDASQ